MRDTTFEGGGGIKNVFFLVLRVPRQYSFVLLLDIHLREGKCLGSEKSDRKWTLL